MAYKKIESYDEATTKNLAEAYRSVLTLIGEDADREGLLKTPNASPRRCSSSRRVRVTTRWK